MPSASEVVGPVALICAAGAAALLVFYLVRRPPLTATIRLLLLFGIGVLPLGAALAGNLAGYEETKSRRFCASCHTMDSYVADAMNPESTSLASFHTRNRQFGGQSCYLCHQNYEMFSAVTTKLTGLRHLWVYATKYVGLPDHGAAAKLELYRPFPNGICTGCHSTTLPGFSDEPEHASQIEEIRSAEVQCASSGCHGPVHPTAASKQNAGGAAADGREGSP